MLSIFKRSKKENKLLEGYLLTKHNDFWHKDCSFELFRQQFEFYWPKQWNLFKKKNLKDGMPFIAIYYVVDKLGLDYKDILNNDDYGYLNGKIIEIKNKGK